MIEVKIQSDVELYNYYFIKDELLYKTKNLNDLEIGDEYCHIFNSPSTPPDIVLVVERKSNHSMKWFNIHLREVINMDYFNIDGIKNFLLGIGEFKNWWELKN